MSRSWMSAVVGLAFGSLAFVSSVVAGDGREARLPQVAGAVALPAGGGGVLPSPKHVVIVIEENKSYSDIIGSPNASYVNSLVARGALLANFHASHHPSQPNYVDFFAGTTLGVCDDKCPSAPFTADNLASALFGAGKTFGGFAENLPPHPRTACKVGNYARKHCPWLDFSNVPNSAIFAYSQFPHTAAGFATLPTVGIVIPNLVHDMHNGISIGAEVKAGDDWLKQNLDAYATWAEANDSLLIVTWDEDSSSYTINCSSVITTSPPSNHIPTLVVGQAVKIGALSPASYDHHDLLRTILDMYGLMPFAGAATATDIDDIWRAGTGTAAHLEAAHVSPPPFAAAAVPVEEGAPSIAHCGDGLWKRVDRRNVSSESSSASP